MPYIQHQSRLMHYLEDGTGTPVVALHASASTGQQWDSLTGYLSGRFRVIRPDLPGYGRSNTLGDNASLSDIAGAVSTLLGEIGEPVHLIGHSFGGAVALKTAHELPHMVRSLTVIEPAAFHLLANDHTGDLSGRQLKSVERAMRAADATGDSATAMARFVDFWNGQGAWARTSEGLREKLARQTRQVMADFTAIGAESATLSDYSAIRCSVLAITGRQSPMVTQHLTECIAKSLRRTQLLEIADAGHMVPLTDPHEVDPAIAAHILAADRHGKVKDDLYALAA